MKIKIYTLLTLVAICISQQLTGQKTKIVSYAIENVDLQNTAQPGPVQIQASIFKIFKLDIETLKCGLEGVTYREGEINGFVGEIALPHPDGSIRNYTVKRNKTLHPDLNATFNEIRTYDAYGTDGSGAFGKWDITPQGLHGMIMIPGESTIFIDPYFKGNTEYYIVYRKDNFITNKVKSCLFENPNDETSGKTGPSVKLAFGTCELRTYRLALSATAEYTTFHGGTVALAQAAQATSMNRVNGVYEKDIAITMVIVPNNNNLIYTNAGTDPFTNGTPGTMINQNQTTCDNIIGSANYDIGHVFGTNSGGLAGLGVVCTGGQKARGVTGSSAPVGDPFDIDYVAHEMGHQFGGNHTQNNNCNSVNAARREPGSASTIMGYAGICAPNVQNNSDDYFHGYNLGEISSEILSTGHQCEVLTALNNTAPTIVSTGGNISVPKSTPFILTGNATDPDGDVLTYLWEQMDNEASTQPPVATATGGPNFRSFDPTTNPSRYFPNLQSLASNGPFTWEVLPSVARVMDFRLTVKDNHAVGSCNAYTDVTVTVVSSAGPFVVTYPSATGITWVSGSTQTVTWNVANTTATPISCANVKILLSTDGGLTYPIVLSSSTPNDGTQSITVPSVSSTTCRVMIVSSSETFFDISDNNFTITCTTPAIPTFNATTTYCQNEAVSPLPNTSTNNIPGTWNTALSTANLGTTTYTFTPSTGLCANAVNLTVTVNPSVTPTFNSLAPLCLNASAPVLPTTSTNGITGTWDAPVSTSTPGNFTYNFTPNTGQCAAVTSLSVTVQDLINPTFDAFGPYCQNDLVPGFPTNSTNGVSGTWSPSLNTSLLGSTTYTFTPNSGQCASSSTANVVINAYPNTQVSQTGITLTSLANNASYQWIDCNNQNTPILGATNQSYTPNAISGSYAVIVSNGSCTATSECFLIDQTSLDELDNVNILLFPNPSAEMLNILWNGFDASEIELLDATGRILANEKISGLEHSFNVSALSNGIYYIKLKAADENYIRKFQKQELK
jgi:hypothetical protein